MMSVSATSAVRTVSLILALVVGSIFFIGAGLGSVPHVAEPFDQYWHGQADTTTGGTVIDSDEALPAPRALQASAIALTSLSEIFGSLILIVLAGLLLARKGFTRIAGWSLAGLGILIIVTAAVAPQLRSLAVDLAIRELGYPIADRDGTGGYTEPRPEEYYLGLWDPFWILNRVELIPFLLGAIIVVLGFLVADGIRLQRWAAASPSEIRQGVLP
jgi:hypothetical protein